MDLVVRQTGATANNSETQGPKRPVRRSRRKHHRIEPYAWLAAGVVGLGMATAATAAPGVAQADDTSASGSSASASADSGASKSATRAGKTDRNDGAPAGDASHDK